MADEQKEGDIILESAVDVLDVLRRVIAHEQWEAGIVSMLTSYLLPLAAYHVLASHSDVASVALRTSTSW